MACCYVGSGVSEADGRRTVSRLGIDLIVTAVGVALVTIGLYGLYGWWSVVGCGVALIAVGVWVDLEADETPGQDHRSGKPPRRDH